MGVITNIEDLRILAERRVPRMFYDYADSGSWTESTYRANSDDFAKIMSWYDNEWGYANQMVREAVSMTRVGNLQMNSIVQEDP